MVSTHSDIEDGFRKGRETIDQTFNIYWITEKLITPEKHLLLLYWLHWSLWLCRSKQTVENSWRDGNTRPSYLPPEKPVYRSRSNRTGHGTRLVWNWERSKPRYVLSPCFLNFCAEYIMWNPGLDEAQAGIKIARRNIDNLRYADDTTSRQKVKKN